MSEPRSTLHVEYVAIIRRVVEVSDDKTSEDLEASQAAVRDAIAATLRLTEEDVEVEWASFGIEEVAR